MAFDLASILFWLKKFVSIVVLPPLAPVLLIALGLLLALRWRRTGFGLAWLGVAAMLAFMTPASVRWMLEGLETDPPITAEELREARAIVILGAGTRRYAPEYGAETLNRLALERVRYGARLARASGLPVLVSGGSPTGGKPEAELMRAVLQDEFGIKVRWTDTASLDTHQNARFAAEQLKAAGIRRIVLVTHAIHMPRARAEFEDAGLEVFAAPTAWFGGPEVNDQVLAELPGPTTAYAGWYAAHEWLGLLAKRLAR
ncbi:YdcF family protein [Azoarcus sp. KH32C]|uniref:YdcF family protein n=1 Tax=Azoarcus sp. KH32C TaxID=748247 RepID=UPI0002386BD1|nr:YdcF family protein [Azoarcus sp. KH32C]BAL26530.1 hypothetical protein AZKH_4251 [Azoarcus sp. KH32C]